MASGLRSRASQERVWDEIPLKVKKLDPRAILPARKTSHAAGYDLYALADVTIPGHACQLEIPLGIAIEVPPGTYGRITERSSIAAHYHGFVVGGVIDADYRGNLTLLLQFPESPYGKSIVIPYKDAIAQLILERIITTSVEEVDELSETSRGAGGFGSTNKKT